ncbi:PREDICTED: sodium/hydrogen exchanger 10-like [Thamnophis sirtalis]|uniref:Sodium/hydrogen exchanger 10-like n=1 Tax=Thamnophis sirtalis TaxID=35019 RepID=A0A6I9XZG2_9SAUR|nr:PREDICTED: sodium/hydrogen exchanger 10-like [Thamnophis sirtalis]
MEKQVEQQAGPTTSKRSRPNPAAKGDGVGCPTKGKRPRVSKASMADEKLAERRQKALEKQFQKAQAAQQQQQAGPSPRDVEAGLSLPTLQPEVSPSLHAEEDFGFSPNPSRASMGSPCHYLVEDSLDDGDSLAGEESLAPSEAELALPQAQESQLSKSMQGVVARAISQGISDGIQQLASKLPFATAIASTPIAFGSSNKNGAILPQEPLAREASPAPTGISEVSDGEETEQDALDFSEDENSAPEAPVSSGLFNPSMFKAILTKARAAAPQMGLLAQQRKSLQLRLPFVKIVANIDPILFLHLFTPIIIFTAAFEMDLYIFRKSFWQVVILSVPGFLMNCAFLGWITYKINKYNWSWDDSMLFGIILSTTDPILSVASVKNLGLSKIVINLIKGESLFNDATTVIIFELYKDLINQSHQEVDVIFGWSPRASPAEWATVIPMSDHEQSFPVAAFGFLSSRIVLYWLQHIFNDGIIEVVLSFSMAYIIFFIAEWLGMSGVIALSILGLLLDSVSFSPGMDVFLYKFLVILTLSPFLSRLGYGFNWRWGAIIVWSGMRGTFTLNMALQISQSESETPAEASIKNQILMHSGTASLLTLIINSTTVRTLVITLGLCNITLPKRMAMFNAIQRIRKMEANTFAMLKLDRFLADANWAMAEKAIKIDYPYRASYQKQYNSGMLNQDAAQILIGAAESYVDINGKFMNIHEVKTYWESKGILVTIKNWLTEWVHSVKEESFKQSRNRFLRTCYQLATMEEFEYICFMVTLLNCFPIALYFILSTDTPFFPQLKMCNYYFLALYILEALLKISAVGRNYFNHHWNQFDVLIIIIGSIDVVVINIVNSVSPTYAIIYVIRILRFLRVVRVLRLFKLMIPKMIFLLNKQINKQLTFRYDIAKGYVQGEEDVKSLIGQIAGHEKVYVVRLMQRDYPDIVIAVKTKQAVQTVLNTAFETLKFMISGGIVDKNEGNELHKVILLRKQQIGKLPPTIAPPTAHDLLCNIVWLQGNKKQIEYIQKKADILYYDYGDNICEEGDMPQGIHLIVSGMIKLSGKAPSYGVSKEVKDNQKEADKNMYERIRKSVTSYYTDYLVTGAIIGELNCLTKQEMEFGIVCETAVQTCFISIDDLFEAFDTFLDPPSLEYKIWLKIALDVALKAFKEILPNMDWSYRMCMQFSNTYVVDVPNHTKCDIYDEAMDEVILVHGTVQDCQSGEHYLAPFVLPKTCHQVQGTSAATKLLIIRSEEKGQRKSTGTTSSICQYHSRKRFGEEELEILDIREFN